MTVSSYVQSVNQKSRTALAAQFFFCFALSASGMYVIFEDRSETGAMKLVCRSEKALVRGEKLLCGPVTSKAQYR